MITMIFKFGSPDGAMLGMQGYIPNQPDQTDQFGIATIMLYLVVLFIPIMLLVKPCVFKCNHKAEVHEEAQPSYMNQ